MNHNILLVEPNFPIPAKSKNHKNFLPIGLLKIASFLRSNGKNVLLRRGLPNTFEEINAHAILEHLESRVKPWNELRRIAKNGCIIDVDVPHYSGYTGYDDPTHYHRYSQHAGNMVAQMWGFKILSNKIIFSWGHKAFFLKIFNPLVNIWPRVYERFFANIFPSQELAWKFEVIKD